MKSGKQHLTDGMELPNQDKIRTIGEKETYKYLGILDDDTIKQVETKEKIKKEYLRRTRKLLEAKPSSRNCIKGINTWAVSLVRYARRFLKWTREELKLMDQRTRKLVTMHKALHSKDDVDRLYVSREWGKRTCQHWKQCWHIDITIWGLYREAWRMADYSHQKRDRQHDGQQYLGNKNGKKTTLWALSTTNKQHFTRGNLDVTQKGKL